MKARPRRVENKVAEFLTEYLQSRFGSVSKVERIPVLGRAGPDIDILPVYRIAIDVKSRKANPIRYKLNKGTLRYFWGDGFIHIENKSGWVRHPHIACRLDDLDLLFDTENEETDNRPGTKTVSNWLVHMDEWCDENKPILPALVLHWPGTAIKRSAFVILDGDRRTLNDRRERFNDL
jgi:hypothetical protein